MIIWLTTRPFAIHVFMQDSSSLQVWTRWAVTLIHKILIHTDLTVRFTLMASWKNKKNWQRPSPRKRQFNLSRVSWVKSNLRRWPRRWPMLLKWRVGLQEEKVKFRNKMIKLSNQKQSKKPSIYSDHIQKSYMSSIGFIKIKNIVSLRNSFVQTSDLLQYLFVYIIKYIYSNKTLQMWIR